jgi:FK506-binding nuclear protein
LDGLPDSDSEEEEDSEDEEMEYDTLDNMLLNADSESEEDESEEDELDGLAHPRIMELDDDEEEEVPQLVKSDKKSKKRAAEDDAVAGSSAKAEDNRSKKLKTNAGDAVAAGKKEPVKADDANKKEKPKSKKEAKKEAKEAKKNEQNQTNGKKVQFAEKLEQGPTPAKAAQGPRNVGGVMVDDKKTGTGPAAKKGDKVGMRYIGKLKDGKVFDGMWPPFDETKLTDDSQQEGLAVQVQDWRRRGHQGLGHWRPGDGGRRRAPHRHSGASRLRQQGNARHSRQL